MGKPKYNLDDLISLKRQHIEIELQRVRNQLDQVDEQISAYDAFLTSAGAGAEPNLFNPAQHQSAMIARVRQDARKAVLQEQKAELEVELKRCLTR